MPYDKYTYCITLLRSTKRALTQEIVLQPARAISKMTKRRKKTADASSEERVVFVTEHFI